MLDTILYRRFTIVALMIAAMGVVAANVIVETRPRGIVVRQSTGALEQPCPSALVCQILKPAAKLA
jgi:hypothetical protein